jgi:hypothetical protein
MVLQLISSDKHQGEANKISHLLKTGPEENYIILFLNEIPTTKILDTDIAYQRLKRRLCDKLVFVFI